MTAIYGGQGLGIQGLRDKSSFEAATGIGMGSNHKVPLNRARLPTPDSCAHLSSRSSPQGPRLDARSDHIGEGACDSPAGSIGEAQTP